MHQNLTTRYIYYTDIGKVNLKGLNILQNVLPQEYHFRRITSPLITGQVPCPHAGESDVRHGKRQGQADTVRGNVLRLRKLYASNIEFTQIYCKIIIMLNIIVILLNKFKFKN